MLPAGLQMAGHPPGVCGKPGGVLRSPVCRHLQGLLGQRFGWPFHLHGPQRQWLTPHGDDDLEWECG